MALTAELTQSELERLFAELTEEWRDETGGHSVVARIVQHPAYLKIIGLGPRAVPLILRDLEANGGWWFIALESMTRDAPMECRGTELDYRALRESWLDWGRQHGYLAAV